MVRKVIPLNPQIIEKNGKKEFVILPYEKYLQIEEILENYEELKILRQAKKEEANAETKSLKDVKKEFNL